MLDGLRIQRGFGIEQAVLGAVGVVVDRVEIAVRTIGEHRGDPCARLVHTRYPSGHQRRRAHAPATAGVVGRGQGAAGPDRVGRPDPVHLVEGAVVDVGRVDARAQTPHQARLGRLAEDGGAYGVYTDELHLRLEPS